MDILFGWFDVWIQGVEPLTILPCLISISMRAAVLEGLCLYGSFWQLVLGYA